MSASLDRNWWAEDLVIIVTRGDPNDRIGFI